MESAVLVDLLLYGTRLKQTPRTGWVLRGVSGAESVADHSYGAAFTALILSRIISEPCDVGRLLSLALIHDLPEGISSDIPSPAWSRFPVGLKENIESRIMDEVLGEDPWHFGELWNELQEGISVEARIVQDADLLDLMIQALVYEDQTGNRSLAEFWDRSAAFNYPQAHAVWEELRNRRSPR